MCFIGGGALGVASSADHGWAASMATVVRNHFVYREQDVFEGLVIYEGNEMLFSKPGESNYRDDVPSPSICITPLEKWRENVGGRGNSLDWTCVLCHEIIHYLHWRWTVLDNMVFDTHGDKYEDEVSGQHHELKGSSPRAKRTRGFCGIPGFVQKEDSGLKELADPPVPFTENSFRERHKLPLRSSYSSTSEFASGPSSASSASGFSCCSSSTTTSPSAASSPTPTGQTDKKN
jgi:hypothetical protein